MAELSNDGRLIPDATLSAEIIPSDLSSGSVTGGRGLTESSTSFAAFSKLIIRDNSF
jgi:hypothetical protein